MVVLVVGVLVFSPVTHIFQIPVAQAEQVCAVSIGGQYYYRSGIDMTSSTPCHSVAGGELVDNTKVNVSGKALTGEGGSPGNEKTDLFGPIFNFLSQGIYIFTVGVGGFFASAGAAFLNFAVHISLSSTAYGMQFVSDGWGTARDLANMFFILILIYIAVTIMLEADTGKTMHLLVRVLFIALVINFSFFVTRVVIDAGNFTAVQFYNQIDSGGATTVGSVTTKDLGASIMTAVGAEDLLKGQAFENFKASVGGAGEFVTILVMCLFLGATYAILAAIFVATGIKFIIRVAVLWLTIVASPLALVASTVPQFESWFKKWRDALISNSFFPVVFLFIFWLITKFAGDLSLSGVFENFNEAVGSTNAAINIVGTMANIGIRLGFLVVMLLMGLKVADELGEFGAQAANKIGFGLPGFAARNTVGWGASWVSQRQGLANTSVGRGVLRVAGGLSRQSFDLRNVPGVGKLNDNLGSATGKGGYAAGKKKREEKRQHSIEEMGKALKSGPREEWKTKRALIKKARKEMKAAEREIGEANMKGDHVAAFAANKRAEKARKDIDDARKNAKAQIAAQDNAVMKKIERKLTSRNWRNLFLGPSRATIKAADHLVHGKSTNEQLADLARKAAKEADAEKEKGDAASKPAAPAPRPATNPPAGGGGHDGEDH